MKLFKSKRQELNARKWGNFALAAVNSILAPLFISYFYGAPFVILTAISSVFVLGIIIAGPLFLIKSKNENRPLNMANLKEKLIYDHFQSLAQKAKISLPVIDIKPRDEKRKKMPEFNASARGYPFSNSVTINQEYIDTYQKDLSKEYLHATLGHEIAHLKNYDTLISAVAKGMIVSSIVTCFAFVLCPTVLSLLSLQIPMSNIVWNLGIHTLTLATLFGTSILAVFAMDRTQETIADLDSVYLNGKDKAYYHYTDFQITKLKHHGWTNADLARLFNLSMKDRFDILNQPALAPVTNGLLWRAVDHFNDYRNRLTATHPDDHLREENLLAEFPNAAIKPVVRPNS